MMKWAEASCRAVLVLGLVAALVMTIQAQQGSTTDAPSTETKTCQPVEPPFGDCQIVANECLRTRTVVTADCEEQEDFFPCDINECLDEACELSQWTEWTDCSVTCGEGTQTRVKEYIHDLDVECPEAKTQDRPCNLGECPTPSIVIEGSNMIFHSPYGDVAFMTAGDATPQTLSEVVDDLKKHAQDSITAATASLQSAINQATSSVTGLVNELRSDVEETTASLKTQIESDLALSLESVQTKVDGAVSDISRLNSDVAQDMQTLETFLSEALAASDDKHGGNHDQQDVAIGLLDARLRAIEPQLADLKDTAATKTSVSSSLDALEDKIDNKLDDKADADKLQALIDGLHINAPVLNAPDAAVIWHDTVTLTWAAPNLAIPIVKYVISYKEVSGSEKTEETEDAATSYKLSGLKPATAYDIKVSAVTRVATSSASNIRRITTKSFDVRAKYYFCKPSGWSTGASTGRGTVVCEIKFDAPTRGIVHAMFTGHGSCGRDWMYGTIYINDDDGDEPGSQKIKAPAHTYTPQWETFSGARHVVVDKGPVYVRLRIRSNVPNTCALNGHGMHAIFITAPDDSLSNALACEYNSGDKWSYHATRSQPGKFCTINFSLKENSIVHGHYTGHVRVDGSACYGTVGYDGDADGNPSQQRFGPAHTYTTQWENWSPGRSASLAKGNHRADPVTRNDGGNVWLNGAGFSAFFAPNSDGQTGTFGCAPGTWSYYSSNNIVQPCAVNVDLPYKAVVFAQYNGHVNLRTGTCYGVVSFNNDGAAALNAYGGNTLQVQTPAHSYNTVNWESFPTGRGIVLGPGRVTVGLMFRCGGQGWVNGAGLTGYWIRYDDK